MLLHCRFLYDELAKAVNAGVPPRPEQTPTPVFVNISNHPSDRWPTKQLAAAREYADRIVDIPFPQVEPDMDTAQVQALADEVIAKLPPGAVAAMVSGEFVLTTTLVKQLQRHGVTCLAATTRRQVRERGNEKITVFDFVQFREYPRL